MSIPAIHPYALPDAAYLPANRVPWQPKPGRCALLICDMQQYFVDFFQADQKPLAGMLKHIARLAAQCRRLGIPVIYAVQPGTLEPRERGLLGHFWGQGLSAAPRAGADIVAALAPEPGDTLIEKRRYSAFHDSSLLHELRRQGRDQVIVCGLYAHIGCLATALDAFMHDVQPFLVADAMADFSEADHRMALAYAARRCAAVLSTGELLARLDAWPPEPAISRYPALDSSERFPAH